MIDLPDEHLEALCLLAIDRAAGYLSDLHPGAPAALDDGDRAALGAFRGAIARAFVG